MKRRAEQVMSAQSLALEMMVAYGQGGAGSKRRKVIGHSAEAMATSGLVEV